jgi:hypothetical protein
MPRHLRGVYKTCPVCNSTHYRQPSMSHLEHCSNACRNATQRARKMLQEAIKPPKLPKGQKIKEAPLPPVKRGFDDTALAKVMQPNPPPVIRPGTVVRRNSIPD